MALSPLTDPERAARAEIERLHALLRDWFQGNLAKDRFDEGFVNRLHTAFENIQPGGHVLTRAELLDPIRDAHGSNPDFRIEIRDVRVLGAWTEPRLIQATYVEAQFGARNTDPPDNLRRSTVLFEAPVNRLVWRHIQETAIRA